MIVTKHRQLYYKQKGNGIGFINKENAKRTPDGVFHGEGLFTDSMKMLGKKIWIAGKTLFKNQILPNLKDSALHAIKSGRQLIQDNKKEIAEVISNKSKELLKSMLNRSNNNLVSNSKDPTKGNSRDILNKLLYGESIYGNGLKIIPNRNKKRIELP